jgi:putative two-component system response regulator
MSTVRDTLPRLLLVDDEPLNLQVLRQVLNTDYRLLFATDGGTAIDLALKEQPDLILLDVMMPGLSGLSVCERLKAEPATAHIPVIFVTALAEEQDETGGFAAGAVDYITKPISPPVVRARVRTHLSLVRAETLRQTRLQIVQRLGRAAEYKDNETGLHVIRMSHYARLIGEAIGYGDSEAEELLNAAPMHDVGKIGIPDAILRKPGKLDPAEWSEMQRHPLIGAEIIGSHAGGLLKRAHDIALGHHEKWDGSGYPFGKRAEEIPLDARIVAVADVFDALTSVRPYKPAWTVEQALGLLRDQAGAHFEPRLVEAFLDLQPRAREIMRRWAEPGSQGAD